MRKVISVIAIMLVVLCCFHGCGAEAENETKEEQISMFVVVEEANSWAVLYHRETKVMYVMSRGGYNTGNFTVLLNPDGSPLVWDSE